MLFPEAVHIQVMLLHLVCTFFPASTQLAKNATSRILVQVLESETDASPGNGPHSVYASGFGLQMLFRVESTTIYSQSLILSFATHRIYSLPEASYFGLYMLLWAKIQECYP